MYSKTKQINALRTAFSSRFLGVGGRVKTLRFGTGTGGTVRSLHVGRADAQSVDSSVQMNVDCGYPRTRTCTAMHVCVCAHTDTLAERRGTQTVCVNVCVM